MSLTSKAFPPLAVKLFFVFPFFPSARLLVSGERKRTASNDFPSQAVDDDTDSQCGGEKISARFSFSYSSFTCNAEVFAWQSLNCLGVASRLMRNASGCWKFIFITNPITSVDEISENIFTSRHRRKTHFHSFPHRFPCKHRKVGEENCKIC